MPTEYVLGKASTTRSAPAWATAGFKQQGFLIQGDIRGVPHPDQPPRQTAPIWPPQAQLAAKGPAHRRRPSSPPQAQLAKASPGKPMEALSRPGSKAASPSRNQLVQLTNQSNFDGFIAANWLRQSCPIPLGLTLLPITASLDTQCHQFGATCSDYY